jgi:hypothetical protein
MLATGLTLIATLLLVCLLLVALLRQKRQLKQQLAEHHALLHAHPDGLLLVDADGLVNCITMLPPRYSVTPTRRWTARHCRVGYRNSASP